MANCPQCGMDLGEPPPPACQSCGFIFALHPPSPASQPDAEYAPPPPRPFVAPVCSTCRVPLNRAGELNFRVGGSVGAAGLFKGNWNQLSEQLQPFSVYHCPSCGKIELYEPGR